VLDTLVANGTLLVATEDTYTPGEIAELEERYCGRVEVLERMATVSTSARLRRIQLSGAIGLRVRRIDREEAVLMTLRQKVDPSLEADMLAARQLLGLDPAGREFQVVYGAVAANDTQIAILSRSILEILVDLSSFIDVPEAHVTDRRVTPTAEPEVGPSGPIRPLIRIGSSPDRPADAFLAVPYRGYWFWIDDRDMGSKRLFSFLMFIFTLVETGGKENAPVLTIPTQ
jgi:hypothetical protein